MNTRIKGILQCALGALCWGASGIAGQYLLVNRDISPEWLTFCRLLSAGVLLLLIFSLAGQTGIWSIWQHKKDRIRILVFGMLGMIWTQYGYFAAIKYSNAPTATVLEYLMPILIIFWYCLSERRLPRLVEISARSLPSWGPCSSRHMEILAVSRCLKRLSSGDFWPPRHARSIR